HELSLRDLLPRRRAAPRRRGDDRRRRGLRSLAGEGRDRGGPGRPVLGARAPGLPRALPERLHVPLPAPELGAPPARGGEPGLTKAQARGSVCSATRTATGLSLRTTT